MDKVNPDKDQDLSSRNTFDRTYANNDNNEIKNKNDRNTFDRTYEINQTHNISDQIISPDYKTQFTNSIPDISMSEDSDNSSEYIENLTLYTNSSEYNDP